MSIYNALYGRDGHGVGPNEPEKKGFARFCQMVGRDLGQLLGTNLMVCVLCLPAALGVSLGVTLLSLPLTVVCSAVTGLLTGPAMVLLADCALRSLQNDPSQWLPRAKQTLAAHWKAACGFGCIGTLVLGLLCFVSAFVFEAAAQQGITPGLPFSFFWRWIFWCWRFWLRFALPFCRCNCPPRTACCAGRAGCWLSPRRAASWQAFSCWRASAA